MGTVLWVDASAGIAGDMLAGALIDAGAPLDIMRTAVDAVVPGLVTLETSSVHRSGMRATKLDVTPLEIEPPHRHLSDIRALVEAAPIAAELRQRVVGVFERLAVAEAAAHGVSPEEVHFHEVGAADSIADVVAACAGMLALDIEVVQFGRLELGTGFVRGAHGRIPVPTPAALQLTQGLTVSGGLDGECATPTGLALLTSLGSQSPMPAMRLRSTGVGAGTRDPGTHANVVRVAVGVIEPQQLLLEANIDDMDPRLWPGAIDAIMQAGARDAWLTPIVMKKGRPALTLSVLCTEDERSAVEDAAFRATTTIGLRVLDVEKVALDRGFTSVNVLGQTIAVKYAGRLGHVLNVSVEWEDVAAAAAALGRPEREVLAEATAAARASGLRPGASMP